MLARRPPRQARRRRLVAALLAAALVATACSDDGDGITQVGGDVVTPGDSTPTEGGASDGGQQPPDQGSGGGSPPGDGGASGPGSPAPPGGAPGGGPAPQPDDTPSPRGGPGSFAPGYLRPAPFDRIAVDILFHEGASLRQSSLDHALGTLTEVSAKTVTVVGPTGFDDGRTRWDGDSIRAASDAHGRAQHGDGQAVMRVLALRGEFAPNENAIGVAVRGDTMAVFVDKVREASTPLIGSSEIEKAVTLHEVGHLLGLVDLYLQTGRQDPDHPGHSTNEESVMYWAVESTLLGQVLGGGPPTTFDDADRRDLATIRQGG